MYVHFYFREVLLIKYNPANKGLVFKDQNIVLPFSIRFFNKTMVGNHRSPYTNDDRRTSFVYGLPWLPTIVRIRAAWFGPKPNYKSGMQLSPPSAL